MSKLSLEEVFWGKEPEWDNPKTTLFRALTWYSSQYGAKESKKYTLEFVKVNKYPKIVQDKLSAQKEDNFKNLGFVCRIYTRGGNVEKSWIDNKINEVIATPNINKEDDSPKTNVQDRIFDQGTNYINELEGIVDEFIKTKKSPDFTMYEWLKSNDIKPIYAKQIQEFYRPLLEELLLVKSDSQLTEGYSLWNKTNFKKFIDFISHIISECENYSNNKKIKRTSKPQISLVKKISKLNYKKEDSEYKIVSISPTELFSASQLWIFNAKTRKLGVYYAKDESGLSLKGSTIEGFDEVRSIQKTLRKPMEILPIVTKGKKTELKKLMQEIKSKDDILTGRINDDIILLKAVK